MCSEPLRPRPSDRLVQAPVQVIYLDTISTHMYVPWYVGMDTYVCTASSQVSKHGFAVSGVYMALLALHTYLYSMLVISRQAQTPFLSACTRMRGFFQTAESGGIETTFMPLR